MGKKRIKNIQKYLNVIYDMGLDLHELPEHKDYKAAKKLLKKSDDYDYFTKKEKKRYTEELARVEFLSRAFDHYGLTNNDIRDSIEYGRMLNDMFPEADEDDRVIMAQEMVHYSFFGFSDEDVRDAESFDRANTDTSIATYDDSFVN